MMDINTKKGSGLVPQSLFQAFTTVSRLIRQLLLLSVLAALLACGGETDKDTDTPVQIVTGQFIDDPVEGLSYQCTSSGIRDITNASGEFSCPQGDDVTFFVGQVAVGSVAVVNPFITPYTLFPGEPQAAINLARLLQSVDSDGDPTNGAIIMDVNLVASLPPTTDFSNPSFDDFIASTAPGIALVSAAQAQQVLNNSIAQFGGSIVPIGNALPQVNAGIDQSVSVGTLVTLDGSATVDADNDPLSYGWTFVSKPQGSQAVLSTHSGVGSSFTADVAGNYTVNLMAFDGFLAASDTVTINATSVILDSNPNLSALTLSAGSLSPVFDALTTSYSVEVAYTTNTLSIAASSEHPNALVNVNGSSVASGIASNPIDLAIGDNVIPILVIAEDGSSGKTYTLTVTRQAAPIDFIATLQNLTLGPGVPVGAMTPAFAPNTHTYSLTLDNVYTSIDVVATATNSQSSISVNGIPIISGSSSQTVGLTVGYNTLHVLVTAPAGNADSYFINVIRLEKSNVATLSDLSISSGLLSPAFSPSVTGYSVFVDNSIDNITLTPTTTSAYASVKINSLDVISGTPSTNLPLAVGDNLIPVVVTAEDGATVKTYAVTVVRGDVTDVTDGYLATLSLSSGTLSPIFNATVQTYEVVVDNAIDTIRVTPTPLKASSTVKVNNVAVTSATASQPIGLAPGNNTIQVEVTSGDTTISQMYTLIVTRGPPEAPQNLQAVAGNAEVALAWDASSTATSYVIHFATTAGVTSASSAISVNNAATQYTLPGAVNDQTYYFRVAGVNATGEGALSAEVSAYPQTFIPKGLRLAVNGNQIELNWNPLNGAQSYAVYWNQTGAVTSADNRVDVAAATSFSHLGLTTGTAYYYRVAASENGVEGELSVQVSATLTPIGWVWVNPLPQGNDINDMIWDGSRFVGVGNNGTVITSADGLSWNVLASGSSANLEAIVWNGSQYITVGANGAILSSTNAQRWLAISTTYTGSLTDILWDGTRFVAVGNAPDGVLSSTDGIAWTISNTTFAGTTSAISWNGSQYLILSSDGFSASWVYSSSNGLVWTQTYIGPNGTNDLVWNNNLYVIVGAGVIITSPDGSNWGIQDDGGYTNSLYSVNWANNQFVATGINTLFSSVDGISWTRLTIDTTTQALFRVAGNGTSLVGAGGAGTLLSSSDGTSWAQQSSGDPIIWNDIVWSGSQFVAVGNQSIRTSSDGINWSEAVANSFLTAVDWNGSQFVAVGTGGAIYSSSDGLNWSARDSKTTTGFEGVSWHALNSQFVAVGRNGLVVTSPDAINWTLQNSAVTHHLMAVQSNGSQLVATGYNQSTFNGIVMTSVDGVSWTEQTIAANFKLLFDVVWSGTQFLAVGDIALFTSPDGITWTERDSGVPTIGYSSALWDGSQFIAIAGIDILTSSDGVNWVGQKCKTAVSSAAFDGSQLVAVGDSGVILRYAGW